MFFQETLNERLLFPEIIRLFPKTASRKPGRRKSGRSRILTDTPKRRGIENQRAKKCKMKLSQKTMGKETIKKRLVTVDTPNEEPKNLPYAELSDYDYDFYAEVSDKKIANVPVESFAVGDLEKGDLVLVKLAEERSICHYRAKRVNYFNGYEYEIRYFITAVFSSSF